MVTELLHGAAHGRHSQRFRSPNGWQCFADQTSHHQTPKNSVQRHKIPRLATGQGAMGMVHSEIGRKNSCLTGQGATISVRTGTCPKN
eukprot:9208377-Alexandrium_andersonii.AAC.1